MDYVPLAPLTRVGNKLAIGVETRLRLKYTVRVQERFEPSSIAHVQHDNVLQTGEWQLFADLAGFWGATLLGRIGGVHRAQLRRYLL